MSILRRRYEKWCKGDDIEDCTHKQQYEASYQSMVKVLQQNTCIDDGKFLKSGVQARAEQGNINHPAYGTWMVDFMLRQDESRAFLGKYLNDPHVPCRHKRREMMAIAGIIQGVKWLAKIKQRSDVSCRLCKKAREQRCASTENLPEVMYGHINSAFCDGMETTVTAAHHFIWRYLYASMQAAQTPASKLRFVTPDKESSMNTLWQEKEFGQICSRESLTDKAAEIEKTISLTEHKRELYDFDPTMLYQNQFWKQRPDGILINKNHRTIYILKFKRSSDRNEDFLRVKEDEANEQHKSIIEALKAAAPKWTFKLINFVAERRSAVVLDDFCHKLERPNVQAGKKDKILLAHVQRICEAHDTVMRSYYQQIHGSSGADATTSMENIGEQAYV